MLDYLFGLILIGLGIQSPVARSNFKADKIEVFRREIFLAELKELRITQQAQLSEQKAVFKTKLDVFKDGTKRQKTENVQKHLDEINIKLTDQAVRNIIRISEFLDTVIEKLKIEKANGVNTATADVAIEAAQAAISGAQSVISTQFTKSYVIPVKSEGSVRADALSMKRMLTNDMMTMHESIFASRKAVNTLIRELAKIRGEPLPEVLIK